MIKSPPCEVVGHSLSRHYTVYPGWHILWLILLDLACVCIYYEHLREYVAYVTAARLHQRDGPIGMERIVKFQGWVNQFSIGIAIEVDMT